MHAAAIKKSPRPSPWIRCQGNHVEIFNPFPCPRAICYSVVQETCMSLNKASLLSSLYSSSVLTRKLCHHRTLSAAPRVANTNTTDMTRVVSIVNTDQVLYICTKLASQTLLVTFIVLLRMRFIYPTCS